MSIITFNLLIFAFTIVAYYVSRWWIARRAFLNKIKTIPGPKQMFLVGNSLDFTRCEDVLPRLMQYQNKYGLTFKAQLGGNHYIFTSDPAMIEGIVTSSEQITKTRIYRFMARWIGNGLICTGNPKWRLHRRIIAPTFHYNVLNDFVPIFHKNAKKLIQLWQSKLGSSAACEFDVYDNIVESTLDAICETAMGIEVNALKHGNRSKYFEGIKFMGRIVVERSFHIWKYIDFLYKFSATHRKETELLKVVRQTTDTVIKQKQDALKANKNALNNHDEDKENVQIKQRKVFLDHLLEVNKKHGDIMTDEELRNEVNTLIFAGHDSAASTSSFALYLLAKHPEIQDKVYNELKSCLYDANDKMAEITHKHLSDLKYLDMVIKETLRIYPPASLYLRKLTKDVVYNGQLLPKDINIGVFAYGAHRNPAVFKNPEQFDPDRFTIENINSRSSFAYVPFSAGPRNCIGQKYALMEIKCILASILCEFKFSKPENFEIQPVAEGILKSRNGFRLSVQSRNSNTTK